MLGIFGIINYKNSLLDFKMPIEESKLIFNETKHNSFYLRSNCNNKFSNDKLFYEDDKYLIITDGVIFNSKNIINEYHCGNFSEAIICMYKARGDEFFNLFRGSFSGIFYDKVINKWLIFTDHIGDKKVFYSRYKNTIIISSTILNIVKFYKENNISYEFDDRGGYSLLTQGFMYQEFTLIKEVKKLLPGSYIKICDNKFQINKYHVFTNKQVINQSKEDIIENIDNLFKEAVKRQFNKDEEYGYKHIVSLSGGLDSRMTTWVANKLGYKDTLNYCFSQANYYDDKVSKNIATDIGNEYIFKSLDDAKFLYDIDDAVKINSGISIYYGLLHTRNILKSLNLTGYGLVHTGQLGDVILGTFLNNSNYNVKNYKIAGAYSSKLKGKIENIDLNLYDNLEIFMLYTRGFNGALSGNLAFQEVTESYSPFCDVDFFEYCLSIPIKYRINHKIYFCWVKKKYPDAAKYYYEKLHGKITTPIIINKGKWFIMRCINKVLKSMGFVGLFGTFTKKGMNPFDYWYKNNNDLREFVNSKFNDNISLLNFNKEMKEACTFLFNNGIMTEKFQVLTLLSAIRLLF